MLKKIRAEISSPKCNIDSPLLFIYCFPIEIEVKGMLRAELNLVYVSLIFAVILISRHCVLFADEYQEADAQSSDAE
jgi:hypothetical protein